MASNLDKLATSFCDKNGIQCDKCKDDMELVNIFSKYIDFWSVGDAKERRPKI